MSEIPTPVLIIGDVKMGKDTVIKAKKKYKSYYWETISATDKSCDEIRMSAGLIPFGATKKVLLIQDIPNKKQVRDFIVNLVQCASGKMRFVIWDSLGVIKIDPKKGINKTWQTWINELKKNKEFVLVNNGGDFAEADSKDSVAYVQSLFKKRDRQIDYHTAKIFVDIVGKSRAMLSSEVDKLVLTAPAVVDYKFVVENTYPTSKEAVLYQFANALDGNNYQEATSSLETFLSKGVNANVLSQVIASKARWHLSICDLWNKGLDWNSIKYEILGMGKFPSCVWHNDQLTDAKKKSIAIELGDPENMEKFMNEKLGIHKSYMKIAKGKSTKTVKRGEIIPMPFLADLMIKHVKENIVAPNAGKYSEKELKRRVLDRAINVYLTCSDNLKEVRYSTKNQRQNLHEMVRVWMSKAI